METAVLSLGIIGFLAFIAYVLRESYESLFDLEEQKPRIAPEHVEVYPPEEITAFNAGKRALKVSRMGNFALSWAYVQAEKGDFDSDIEYIDLLTNEMAYRGLFRS